MQKMRERNWKVRLKDKYQKKIVPVLKKEFKIENDLAVPRVEKVVINMGIGDISSDKGAKSKAVNTLKTITGQKPYFCRAKKSIADFDVTQGDVIGLKVTLRKDKMYNFLKKLFTIALPRVRDFRGVKKSAFDKSANYNLGLTEQTIFPEVDYDKIDKVRGLEVAIVTSCKDKKKAMRLLELLGMPFERKDSK